MAKWKKVGVLLVTLAPLAYMFIFMAFILGMILFGASGSLKPPNEPPFWFFAIIPLHLLSMVWITGLVIGYLVHLFKTSHVPQDKKALWAVVLFLGNMFAMPVYWYFYIWQEPEKIERPFVE
ncbi:MAG: hypothetical protein ACTSXZ_00575 [Alphaproteobacteria bacterium]